MQQFTRLIFAPFRAVSAHNHRDQAALTVNAGGYQVKARAGGVAGFQSVNIERFIPQQAVAVLLGDAIPGEALFAIHMIKRGLAVDDGAR